MDAEIRIFSLMSKNGAATKRFWSKILKMSALPKKGHIFPPGTIASNFGRLKQGVVTDVQEKENPPWFSLGTETTEEDMREVLSEEYKENSPPLD